MVWLGTEKWHNLIMDIADQLINSESEIQTYFWESMQTYYQKQASLLMTAITSSGQGAVLIQNN